MFEKGFDLAYGPSGSGKSTWICDIAEYIWLTKKKRTRVYIGDGGAQTYEARGLVEDGIVEMFQYNDRDYPFTIVQQITEGYWPADLKDPDSPLVAPGKKEFEEIGLWVFEGLTVMGEYIMGSTKGALAERAARGEKIGQDSPINVIDPSGLKFGGNAMAHFGFGQRRITDAIQRSKALPGFVMWTAHEQASEDRDNGNEKIIGPASVGKAMTAKTALWFANTLHFTTATKKVKKKDATTGKEVDVYETERRVYTREHADPDGVVFTRYLANSRVATYRGGGKVINPMPEYLTPPDPIRFYEIVEEAKNKSREGRMAA